LLVGAYTSVGITQKQLDNQLMKLPRAGIPAKPAAMHVHAIHEGARQFKGQLGWLVAVAVAASPLLLLLVLLL
jgi:hypothetical protein